MSENLTPFEHRFLNAIEQMARELDSIERRLEELVELVSQKMVVDPQQTTVDQFP